jgi:protein tyrosine phosphatase (PTP) superfamily phosphohydrolase (DUF442 family)
VVPAAPAPVGGLPGTQVPAAPAAPAFPAPGTQAPAAPPPTFPGTSNFPPTAPQQIDYRWQPAPGSSPAPPQITTKPQATLSPPQITQTPAAKPTPPALWTADIPQFSPVKDQVSSGLRPAIEGLDWLKTNRYRTVLHIRTPGEDDSADRKQIEKRGLKYISIEVSPQNLSRQIVDDFNAIVADSGLRPLFVYDRDGSLAGGLWYLYFRTSEQISDDSARIRASALGLRENSDGPHRTMWLAIQKYLGGQ